MLEIHFEAPSMSDGDVEGLKDQFLDHRHYNCLLGETRGEDALVYKPNGRPLLAYLSRPPGIVDVLRPALPALRRAVKWSEARQAYSGTVGFLEPSGRDRFGRATAFTRDRPTDWKSLQPLFLSLNDLYRRVLPEKFALQNAIARHTSDDFVIPGTCFTTATVNGAHRFQCHRDRNNLALGMGVMTVWREEGCHIIPLIFPQWQIGVNLRCGDVLLFDGSDWHGNGPVQFIEPFERISVVCYYRCGLINCGTAAEELSKGRRLLS